MKKLIVLSVVFALVASAAFAVDFGASVIGTVTLFSGASGEGTSDDIITSSAMNQYRVSGSGEAGDGKFGGMIRLEEGNFSGNAYWKPIDQLNLIIGNNGGDGFWGKEGVAGWSFNATVNDTGVGMGGGNVWGGGYAPVVVRHAFFGGDGGDNALRLEIKPIDILGINLKIPTFGTEIANPDYDPDMPTVGDFNTEKIKVDEKTGDMFKKVIAQVDVNLDFGNIALTYVGGMGADDDYDDPAKIYLYYGGSFGDLGIDFGFSYKMDGKKAGESYKNPMGVGLGVKYATDAFGVKFRTVASLAGEKADGTKLLAEVMPYFSLGDNLTAFVSVGIAMKMPDEGDTESGWHFNPYLQIGEEWGAKFLVGVKVWSPLSAKDPITCWAVPIALSVGF